jgi:DNA-binding NarL/FixJ family response regulator
VIALSVHADRRLVALMLDAGASEYVLKDLAFEHLAGTIRAAVASQH